MKKHLMNQIKIAIPLLVIALLLSSCASPEEIGQAATSYPDPILESVAESSGAEGSLSSQSLAQLVSSEVSAAPVSSQASSAPVSSQASSAPASSTSENIGGIPSNCVYTVEPNPVTSFGEPDPVLGVDQEDPRREEYISNAEAYVEYLKDSLTLEDYAGVDVYATADVWGTEIYIWMANSEAVEQAIAENPPPKNQFTLVKHQVDYTAKDLKELATALKSISLEDGERLTVPDGEGPWVSVTYDSKDKASLLGKIEEQIAKHNVPKEQVKIHFNGKEPFPVLNPGT